MGKDLVHSSAVFVLCSLAVDSSVGGINSGLSFLIR